MRAVPDVNNAPAFDAATMTREVNEDEIGDVGEPVTADDRRRRFAELHSHRRRRHGFVRR